MSAHQGMRRMSAFFFRSDGGAEPVRDWLRDFPREDRRAIGHGLMVLEFGWPVGMPLAKSMGHGLHELRVTVSGNRNVRILFYVDAQQRIVLLHGFVKKTARTPLVDLDLARKRMKQHPRSLP
jgi:phage-related protein